MFSWDVYIDTETIRKTEESIIIKFRITSQGANEDIT